tara:strand:- start:6801 stop:7613 length:813 start_codon:yes stop_codon:yes gene_type:complete
MRQYQYQLAQRERNWMQTLAVTSIERVQYEQGIDASNVGLQNFYGDLQEKYGDLVGQAMQSSEQNWEDFLTKSPSSDLAAMGRTGRSIRRAEKIDFGKYMAESSRMAYKLTQAQKQFRKAGAQKAAATRAQQMQMFAQNNVIKSPEIAPPRPVMQNVGQAAFMDALSIAGSIAGIASGLGPGGAGLWTTKGMPGTPPSDRRLKENIKKIGESLSGLGIYRFNYIGQAKKYIGAMADEVIKVVPEAAILGADGFYRVNYDLIDVDFREALA